MSILAIRGHEIRNKEVIGLLKMLEGKNKWNYRGDRIACVYYLNNDKIINYTSDYERSTLKVFTLEEFFEKYPYKVGDKVIISETQTMVTITGMFWMNDKIFYETIYDDDCCANYCIEELSPYIGKEEKFKKISISEREYKDFFDMYKDLKMKAFIYATKELEIDSRLIKDIEFNPNYIRFIFHGSFSPDTIQQNVEMVDIDLDDFLEFLNP